jgi:transposase
VARVLAELRDKLKPFYSELRRPSIDPELMMRMLIVGYCYGLRSERKLCEEVELHLAYRWFCRLDSLSRTAGIDSSSRFLSWCSLLTGDRATRERRGQPAS